MKDTFDHGAFSAALNATRLARQMNWKQVATESGVSASTLTRMSQGKRPDIDGLAALVRWSGLSADDFIGGSVTPDPEPLAQMAALLRADKKLNEASRRALEGVLFAAYERLRTP